MSSKWSFGWVFAFVGMIAAVFGGYWGLSRFFNSTFGMDAFMSKQTAEARVRLKAAKTDAEKCFPLTQIAKDDFNKGRFTEAKTNGEQLLAIAAKLDRNDDEYGVAVHDGNMVLGRLALKDGRTEEAKQYLLKAGMTPGSATLGSFGPNMSLAKDLLEAGEREAVIRYFQECHQFWSYKSNLLKEWEAEVRSGGTPDFGTNLYY